MRCDISYFTFDLDHLLTSDLLTSLIRLQGNQMLDQHKVFCGDPEFSFQYELLTLKSVSVYFGFKRTADLLVNFRGPSEDGVWRIYSEYSDECSYKTLVSSINTNINIGLYIESDIQLPDCCEYEQHEEYYDLLSEIIYFELCKVYRRASGECTRSSGRS